MANIEIKLIEKLTDVLEFAQGCDSEVLTDIERWFMLEHLALRRRVQIEKAAVCRCAAEIAKGFLKNNSEPGSKLNKEQIYTVLYEGSIAASNDMYVRSGSKVNMGHSMTKVS